MRGVIHREERRLRTIFAHAMCVALAAGCGAADVEPEADPQPGTAPQPQPPRPDPTPSAEPPAPAEPSAQADPQESPPIESPAPPPSGEAANLSCAPASYIPDPPDSCGNFLRLPCGLPATVKPAPNCFLWLSDCEKFCPQPYFNCHAVDENCKNGQIVKDASGGIGLDCATCAKGVGRIPAGLERVCPGEAPSALARYFGAVAHLEAASVHAFRHLHRELSEHGAPARLLRAARRAERDEIRHARITGRMARRLGAKPRRPRVAPQETRSLPAVAAENAVEGCVRETFGALVASYQAAHAQDPEIAELMATIARDETRHAALSWSIARWASAQLDAEERAEIAARCQEAAEELRREAEASVDAELAARAGLPGPEVWRALVDTLNAELWATA